ncbi:zinc finger CCCH domain-containing protein 25 [Cornus florida]|uniref:zinc finger CCCH domain-containing protein 25 n=1 Tax=Cornus florida TaxID=4283 RepID=UPI00289B791F|nr:zinc finger CCCH domain-containing protein 25 [Cornus florida]
MNPLTLVKRIQQINSKEAALGISDDASWHAKYKDSAYVFVGGIPFDLTEGDLLAIFSQYGEIVDVNLVRDKGTGKSKGFAFVAYEDQRSTNLAVDNLNGAQVVGRTIRVDHVNKYKKKEEEDEEAERQKREARGVCRAFQRGDCNRGAGCKFSHDEQRAANTGWGHEDTKSARWANDKFEGSMKNEKQSVPLNRVLESAAQERLDKGARNSRVKGNEGPIKSDHKRSELNSRNQDRELEKPSERKKEMIHKEDWDKQATDRRSRKHDSESTLREDDDNREEKRSRRHESESYRREDRGRGDKRSSHDRDSSSHQYKGRDDDHRHRSHR